MDLKDIYNPFHNAQETFLTRDNARALVNWVEEEAVRIGLPEMPVIIHMNNELCNAGAAIVPLEGRQTPLIVITEGLSKHVMGSPNLHYHVPDTMKGIFAHEMSHLKDMSRGIDSGKIRKIPLLALPVLSVIGYELYSRAKHRHEEDPAKTVRQHLSDVTLEEKQASKSRDEKRYREVEKHSLQLGHRVAAIGGGLLAGGMVSSQMALSAEFRADRAAIVASGCSPEAFIQALDKMIETNHKIMMPQIKQWAETVTQRSFMDNIKQSYELIKSSLGAVTIHNHPSHPERLKALRAFVAENGAAIARKL